MRPSIPKFSRARVLVAAFSFLISAAPLLAQKEQSGPNRGFDVRDMERLAAGMSGGSIPKPGADAEVKARAALDSFRTPEGLSASYSLGRFGVPRTLAAQGVPLSLPRAGAPREAALAFLRANRAAFPFRDEELGAMSVAHETGAGALTVVRLHQMLGGLPVYGGRINVAVDSRGRVVQVNANDAAPGLALGPDARLSAMEAAHAALAGLGAKLPEALASGGATPDGRLLFHNPEAPQADTAAVDAVVFPMTSGEGRRAWRAIADTNGERHEIVLDAVTGNVLARVNLLRHRGSARVFRLNPRVVREVVNFPQGWLPDAARTTSGNNAQVFLDEDLDGLPDPIEGNGLVDGYSQSDASGLFDHPAGTGFDFERTHFAAAIDNAFYHANQAHDYFYTIGFREREGALQQSNGNLGGLAGDPIRISVIGVGRGAVLTPAPDGLSPRMRLPLYLSDEGILHSAFDGDTVLHEYAHAVSERLVGGVDDVACLGFRIQGSAIAEGVSDYFAASFFDDPDISEYIPLGRFTTLDANTRTYENLGDPYFEEHADGEIVAAILWQIRTRLGAAATDRLVLDALKLLPCLPTLVDLRDALLTAGGDANRAALWRIFAPRGLGVSARGDDDGDFVDTLFDAAFDLPEDLSTGNNRPPRFLGIPGQFALATLDYIYTARAEDPNGDPITFRLLDGPAGATLNPTTGRLTYRGTFTSQRVVIEATDGRGGRAVHGLLIFGGAIVTPGRAMSISGDRYSRGLGIIEVTGAREALQVITRGGMGDPDLTLLGLRASEVYVSDRPGPNETITAPNPSFPVYWIVYVDGFREYSGVTLTANFIQSRATALNSPTTGLNGQPSSETFFKISVPPGTPRLRITSSGGTGDPDLYLSRGRLPACYVLLSFNLLCAADTASARLGAVESIEVLNPAAGDWFLNVQGAAAYSGLTVTASTEAGAVQLTGATDAASFGAEIASGGIGTLFGTGFTTQTLEAGALPLPTELGGVRVYVDGAPAGLFFVSPTQINFQMPTGAGIGRASIVVVNGENVSQYLTTIVQEQVPRLFTFALGDTVYPVVAHADGSVVTPDNPAAAGEVLVAYLTGAAITPQPADGEAAAADPLSLTVDEAVVTVGGAPAATLFSGATPGFVGLIQVNFQLPANLPPGARLTLLIQFGEAGALALPLPVAP